jgi:hypothetical protein
MATGSIFFIPGSQVRRITPSYSTLTTLGESTDKFSFRRPGGFGERDQKNYVEVSDEARLYGPLKAPPIKDTYIFRGVRDTNLYEAVGETAKTMQTQIYRITNNENGAPLAEIDKIHQKYANQEPVNQAFIRLCKFLKNKNAREVAKYFRDPKLEAGPLDPKTQTLSERLADPDVSKLINKYVGKKDAFAFKAQVIAADMSLSIAEVLKGPRPHTKARRKKAQTERAERFKLAKETIKVAQEEADKRAQIRTARQTARAEQKQWLEESMESAVADSHFFQTEREEKVALPVQKAFRSAFKRI